MISISIHKDISTEGSMETTPSRLSGPQETLQISMIDAIVRAFPTWVPIRAKPANLQTKQAEEIFSLIIK